jgi:hypothetical protein
MKLSGRQQIKFKRLRDEHIKPFSTSLQYLTPPQQDGLVKIVKKRFNLITKILFVDFVGPQPDLFERLTMLRRCQMVLRS